MILQEQTNISSLYEKLGGEASINLAVDKFYDKVINDDRVKHFFANTDKISR